MEKDLFETLKSSKIYLEQEGDCFEFLELASVEVISDESGKLLEYVVYLKKKVKAE